MLAGGTAVAAVFGLLFQALLGYWFGADATTDAFFMSVSIFAFLAKFLMLGQLKSIALPVYQRLEHEGGGERRLAGLLRLTLVGLAGLSVLLALGAPLLVRFLAPGFSPEQMALTERLLRIRIPALAFTGAVTVGLVGLEARSRFGVSVLAQKVLPAVVSFAALAWIADSAGIEGVAWIGLLAAVAGFAILPIAWPRLLAGSARETWHDPEVRGIGRRWLRFSQATAATTLGEWAFRVGASLLPVGFFSAVLYGRRIHDVLHGAINDSVTTVTLPELSKLATTSGPQAVGARLRARILDLLTVSLPVAAATAIAAPWIVSILFGRGRFAADGMVGPTAVALGLYAAGFLVQGVNQLGFAAAYALDHSARVNRIQTVGHGLRAAALVPLVWSLGYVGLVLAQVAMNVVVLTLWVRSWPSVLGLNHGAAGRELLVGVGHRLMATGLGAVGLLGLLRLAGHPAAWGTLGQIAVLTGASAVAAVLFLAAARVLGIARPLRR